MFQQRLDYFRIRRPLQTFNQRYYANYNFVTDNTSVAAAVIYIGGESPLTKGKGGDLKSFDIMGEVAKKYNAPVFSLEHRFYGESQPFSDLKTENLAYLSSQFAIQDLVNFIFQTDKSLCKVTQIPGKTCMKWMIAGGSYAGAVAAWITQQHPHLFAATISASGVVDARFEIPEFDTHTLEAAGTPCS